MNSLFDTYDEQIAAAYQDAPAAPLAPIMGAGERAIVERDLRYGAHPITGEKENDPFKV